MRRDPPAAEDHGYLTINAQPVAQVTIDGRAAGTTPIMRYALPPGAHEVTLTTESGATRTITLEIVSGQLTARMVRLE
jgi:hypothetical protein